ncbi:hypothetical protein [Pontibacter oryzae]|uniref:Uncharacterized protein n=1 Tax=Pontibacter oryzae TaxID=2304593 RepID=A0A399S0H7_9BACT|nr:hypothetical protein [Pontibacter oryzae]RIJ37620.1 hypothetical protein D1627_10970 [Pontibacter oryzae]
MKQLTWLLSILLLSITLCSCGPNAYKRPLTIDRVEISNSAGANYEAQFRRVNRFYMHRFDSLQQNGQVLVFDTTKVRKKPHRLNYTLVSSLDSLNLNGQPGVYYQLYFRPNNGKGKIKGGVMEDKYNELKLFSPQKSFVQHTELFYRDSLVQGATSNIIPVHELYLPENTPDPQRTSFRIDNIDFYKGLNKKQREGIIRIINNAMVLRQRSQAKAGKPFNFSALWLPGYSKDAPATFAITVKVAEDVEKNQIRLSMEYNSDVKAPEWLITKATINRRDYLDGYTYQANTDLNSWIRMYTAQLQYAAQK